MQLISLDFSEMVILIHRKTYFYNLNFIYFLVLSTKTALRKILDWKIISKQIWFFPMLFVFMKYSPRAQLLSFIWKKSSERSLILLAKQTCWWKEVF